jgi:hypothetical protein
VNINQTTPMKRIGAMVLLGCLFLATSVRVGADSGTQPIEHDPSYVHSIERAILMAAETRTGGAQACHVSCDEVKDACNARCVGVTAGSCFARCADEQEACRIGCGAEADS